MDEDKLEELVELAKLKTKRELQENGPSTNVFGEQGVGGLSSRVSFNYDNIAEGHYSKAAKKGDWSRFILPEDMNIRAFEEQTTRELLSDAFFGGVKLAGAGFLDNLDSWNLKRMGQLSSNKALDDTKTYFQELADKIQEGVQKEHQIYTNGDDMWNLPYWSNIGQQTGYSAGIILEMLAEQAILAGLTGGSGNVLGLGTKTRSLSSIGKQAVMGLQAGIRETSMNAIETQEAIYNKFINEGFSKEEAKKKADQAAHIHFKTEAGALMAINTFSNMLLFGGGTKIRPFSRANAAQFKAGFSDFGEMMLENALPSVKKNWQKKALNYGLIPMITEGSEEAIQTGVGAYSEWAIGDRKDSLDLWGTEMRDSFIQGMVSAPFLGAGARMINSYQTKKVRKALNSQIDETLNNLSSRTYNTFYEREELKKAYQKSAEDLKKNPKDKQANRRFVKISKKLEEAQHNAYLATAVNALELDYAKGEGTTAFDTHIGEMQKVLDAVKNKDLTALKEMNLVNKEGKETFKGSLKEIEETFENNIKDSHAIKDMLEQSLLSDTSDFNSALRIVQKQYINRKDIETNAQDSLEREKAYSKSNEFAQLSDEGKQRFKLQVELDALSQVEAMSETKNLTKEQLERKQELEKDLKDLKYTHNDKIVAPNIDKKGLIDSHVSKISREQSIQENNKALKVLKNPENIKNNIKKRKEGQLRKAKDLKEVEKLQKEAQEQNIDVEDIAKDVSDKIKKDNIIANTSGDEVANNTPKPKIEVLEEDKIEKEIDPQELFKRAFASGKLMQEKPQEHSEEDLFSRHLIPEEQLNEKEEKTIQKAIASVNSHKKKLGLNTITLRDYIESLVDSYGKDYVEDFFEGYKYMGGLAGLDISEAQNVYEDIFENPDDYVRFLVVDEINENTNTISNNARKSSNTPNSYDTDGTSLHQIVDLDSKTNKSTTKLAYNFLPFKREGNQFITTKHELVGKSHSILDSDLIKTGDILYAEVYDVDSQEIVVTTTTEGKNITKKMTWGEYKETISKDSLEYKYYIPIKVYKIVGDKKIDTGTFVHSPSWYTLENVTANYGEAFAHQLIKEGSTNVVMMRDSVFSNGGNINLKVTSRDFGHIDKLDNPITLQEASGDSSILTIIATDSLGNIELHTRNNEKVNVKLINTNLNSVNEKTGRPIFNNGGLAELRQVNTLEDGTKEYIALPTFTKSIHAETKSLKQPLETEIFVALKQAMLASMVLNMGIQPTGTSEKIFKDYGMTYAKAKKIRDEIEKDMFIDISKNFNKYANYFIRGSKARFEKVDSTGNTQIVTLNGLTKHFNIEDFKKFFGENGLVHQLNFNVDRSSLNSKVDQNSYIPMADVNGNITRKYKGYNNLVRNFIHTNVKSYQIEDYINGDKKWVTDVHPTVTYEIGGTQQKEIQQKITIQKNKEEAQERLSKSNYPQEFLNTLTEEEKFLLFLGIDESKEHSSRVVLKDEEVSILEDSLDTNNITGLSDVENFELVDSLKHLLLSSIDINEPISLNIITKKLSNLLNQNIKPKLDTYKELKNKLENFKEKTNSDTLDYKIIELEDKIEKLENILSEEEKLIGKKSTIYEEVNRLFSIEDKEVFAQDHLKTSLEKDISLSYSDKLRLFFFGVPKTENNNKQSFAFLTGLPKFENPETVKKNLNSVTTEISSDWDTLILALTSRAKPREIVGKNGIKTIIYDRPLFNDIKHKIEKLPTHLKNELLYKNITAKFTAHKVLYSDIGDGRFSLKVIDENSSKETLRLKSIIRENFIYSSPLTTYDEETGGRVLNKEVAEKYIEAFEKHREKGTFKDKKNTKKLKEVFKFIGIELSDNTVERYIEENDLFASKTGLFTHVLQQLKDLNKSKEPVSVLLEGNNLFDTSVRALNKLIDLEVTLNGTFISSSIRVNDKTLQGVIQNSSAFNTLRDLLEDDSKTLRDMLENPYSKDNFLLKALSTHPGLKKLFNPNKALTWSSPDSFKINKKSNYRDTDYDKLSTTDRLISDFGAYTNERGMETVSDTNKIIKGLDFRPSRMPFMTLSDKGRMLFLKTMIINFNEELLNLKDNKVEVKDFVLNFILDQIFFSDYNRIVSAYRNGALNIKGFDKASKIFTSLPIFNTIEIEGLNIHEYLKEVFKNSKNLPDKNLLKEEAKKILIGYINSEVDVKLDVEGQGLFKETGVYKNKKLYHLDTKYLEKYKGTSLEKGRKLITEQVINNLLHQNNLYHMFLGDMAYYSKDSKILDNEGFVDSKYVKENYIKIAQKIGTAIDKRSAQLIAPGFLLANSSSKKYKDSKYIQIQINDKYSVSETIESYIRASKDTLSQEEEEALKKIKNVNINEEEYKTALNFLKDLNPQVAAYFDITGTDAQEYNTWQTHIDILFRQGKISEENKKVLKIAYDKLTKGENLNSEELKVVMQPIKPVYSGFVTQKNKKGKVVSMRPMYIKSSAFPLLPQLTKNLKIDNLRKNLEHIERVNPDKLMVRASYQTANKIASNDTLLTSDHLFDNTPEQLESLVDSKGRNILESSKVILDTKNLRIQQETPLKTEKGLDKGKNSSVKLGSQMWKIIESNGINKISEKVFPNLFPQDLLEKLNIKPVNGKISGEELSKINFHVYSEYSDIKKSLLYEKLNLNFDGDFKNLSREKKKNVLKSALKILEKEISTRNYPQSLKEVLGLIETEDGEVSLKSPLFLDSNSNKFESLLLSLITKDLIFHKVPGTEHIVGSSEGFQKVDSLEEYTNKSGIVWVNDHTDSLKATRHENGSLKEAEILIKSHFRITDEGGNTKLIDLTSDEYSENIIENGKVVGRKIKTKKDGSLIIDEELLTSFSYRIPTSSHQSGTILKIVGFIPEESGDLLLVPKDHTIQLGEDYDIDKRQVLKSNYIIRNGNIEKLNKEHFNYVRHKKGLITWREKQEALYQELKSHIDEIKQENKELYEDSKLNKTDEVTDKLFKSIFGNEYKTNDELRKEIKNNKEFIKLLKEAFKYEKTTIKGLSDRMYDKLEKEFTIKLHENSIIDVFKSVYQSNSKEVQRKIFKPLSVDVAGDTAKFIDNLINQENNPYFSVLSDNYQRKLLKAGSDGKNGISIHSNGVTFQAALQRLDKKVVLRRMETIMKDGEEKRAPIVAEEFIGELFSSGILGSNDLKSIDGNRDIADQIGENQNVSTDNINEQIMIKRNENIYTIPTFNLMAMRGFDMSLDGVREFNGKPIHVPSVFMSQPIIRDFVDKMSKANSIVSEFSKDKEYDVILELIEKYKGSPNIYIQEEKLLSAEKYLQESKSMTGQNLVDNLIEYNPTTQLAILQKFLNFRKEAKQLSTIQKIFNLSTSGLGKSYFETLEKIDALDNLPTSVHINITELIGKYVSSQEYTEEAHLNYKKVGEYYWKPTTIEGKMLLDSLEASQKLMDIHFPYKEAKIRDMFTEIGDGEDLRLDVKYEIMQEFRSFLNSHEEANYFRGDLNQERRRLFFDTKDNTSLASIIKTIQNEKLPVSNNAFIRELSTEIRFTNEPSRILDISHDSSVFDNKTRYNAFKALLNDDTTIIGKFNGEDLTPRKLAQDLTTASLLSDFGNLAVSYNTLISPALLDSMGYYSNLRKIFKEFLSKGVMYDRFIKQYLQHNPNRATNISVNNTFPSSIKTEDEVINKKLQGFSESLKNPLAERVSIMKNFRNTLQDLKSFAILDDSKKSKSVGKFVTIRNTSDKSGFRLYEYNDYSGYYERIPTLGISTVKEYNSSLFEQDSLIPSDYNFTNTIAKDRYKEAESGKIYAIPKIEKSLPATNVRNILETYLKSKHTPEKDKEFIKNLLEYGDLSARVVYTKVGDRKIGKYLSDVNEIHIDSDIFDIMLKKNKNNLRETRDKVREIILEEVIHSMTVREFSIYIENISSDKTKVKLKDDAPLFAKKILSMYEAAREVVPYDENNIETYYSKNIFEFIAGMFVAPDYRAALEKNEKGFIKKFLDALKNLFNYFYKQKTGEVLDYKNEMFNSVYDLLKTVNQIHEEQVSTIKENPMNKIIGGEREDLKNNAHKLKTNFEEVDKDKDNPFNRC